MQDASSEVIQMYVNKLSHQVSAVTTPLTEHVQKVTEIVSQAQQMAMVALQKASAIEVGTT